MCRSLAFFIPLAALCFACAQPGDEGPIPLVAPSEPAFANAAERADPWATEPAGIPWTDWHDSHPWLTDISSWYAHFERRSGRMTRRYQGAFGLGNGHAFGLIGLGPTLNTLSNTAGPDYQQGQNFFGETRIGVAVDGVSAEYDEEWAYRTRQTAINGTLGQTAQGIEVFTTDFAPVGYPAIIRIITVRNGGRQAHELRLSALKVFDRDESVQVMGGMVLQERGGKASWMTDLGSSAPLIPQGDGLSADLGTLASGQTTQLVMAHVFTFGPDLETAQATADALRQAGAEALMLQTRSHWRSWLSEGAQLTAPAERLEDLYEGMQLTIGVQTAANGAVSPMSRYTSTWLRDTIGPSRFFTRIGRLGDAWAMLDYLYKSAAMRGAIANSTPLNLDVDTVTEPADPDAFWEAAQLMPGRNPVEAPSYLPLQYAFYYRHTADADLIDQRYAYLRRAVTGQARTDEGLMTFSGDETFRIALMTALGIWQDPTDVAWSSNSAFAYVAALRELATLAEAIGRPDDAALFDAEADTVEALTDELYRVDGPYLSPAIFFRSESPHPYPFEDVSTKPIFFGAADPDTADTRALVGAYVDYLMRDDGTLLTPDGAFGRVDNIGYTGMVPGLNLYNLAKVDHPAASLAFDALALTASPSGNWQEIHWKDHSSASITHAPSGRGTSEAAARYRPWEGGEDVDAAVVYLIGNELNWPARRLSLAPHLPDGWQWLTMTELPAGPTGRYDVSLHRAGGMWTVTLTSHLDEALVVDLRLAEAGGSWGDMRINDEPCARCETKTVYETMSLMDAPGVLLPAGGAVILTASY